MAKEWCAWVGSVIAATTLHGNIPEPLRVAGRHDGWFSRTDQDDGAGLGVLGELTNHVAYLLVGEQTGLIGLGLLLAVSASALAVFPRFAPLAVVALLIAVGVVMSFSASPALAPGSRCASGIGRVTSGSWRTSSSAA